MPSNKHREPIARAIAFLKGVPKGTIHANAVQSLLAAYEQSRRSNSALVLEVHKERQARERRVRIMNDQRIAREEHKEREARARQTEDELCVPVPPPFEVKPIQ